MMKKIVRGENIDEAKKKKEAYFQGSNAGQRKREGEIEF
jgi:hypothetical protein